MDFEAKLTEFAPRGSIILSNYHALVKTREINSFIKIRRSLPPKQISEEFNS
jgi:hypothetical protein